MFIKALHISVVMTMMRTMRITTYVVAMCATKEWCIAFIPPLMWTSAHQLYHVLGLAEVFYLFSLPLPLVVFLVPHWVFFFVTIPCWLYVWIFLYLLTVPLMNCVCGYAIPPYSPYYWCCVQTNVLPFLNLLILWTSLGTMYTHFVGYLLLTHP